MIVVAVPVMVVTVIVFAIAHFPAIVVAISVVFAVPMMIMLHSAAFTGPVAHEVLPAIMPRCYPIGALVRRSRPVAFMPPIVVSHRIPIACHPSETRLRSHSLGVYHPRWRRHSDGYAH
jgi:hypothetical protein